MDDNADAKQRKADSVPRERRQQVSAWQERVLAARKHHQRAFARMRWCQKFVRGHQWGADTADPGDDWDETSLWDDDQPYVVNLAIRHVSQRVSGLYAKNPKATARVRKRMIAKVWDESQASLQWARQTVMQANMAAMAGAGGAGMGAGMPMMQPAMPPEVVARAQQIIQDSLDVHEYQQQLRRLSQTLEILYQHQVDEQHSPFKTMMRRLVRRAAINGVGWVRLGYQRITGPNYTVVRQIADLSRRLEMIQRAIQDIGTAPSEDDDAEVGALNERIAALQKDAEIVLREGLSFEWPGSTAIIPDMSCQCLSTFHGSRWVAQEHHLTVNEIKELFGVDVSDSFTRYKGDTARRSDTDEIPLLVGSDGSPLESAPDPSVDKASVFEVYDIQDRMVRWVCEGYPDYLVDPSSPEVETERFWPWYGFVLNDSDEDALEQQDRELFPPSDVWLLRHPQMEINRSREGLREHRIANRPAYANASGTLDQTDKEKLEHRKAHEVVELRGLAPGQKVDDLLQPMRGFPIDPNLYETNPFFTDVLHGVGTQEANLGGAAGATATESSIAESSRMSGNSAAVDDLDELLSALARAGGQVLLSQMPRETVAGIVGPGAFWPELTREQRAQEVFLEIEAGSSGRPNQAAEVQNINMLAPILLQIPGINPEWLARQVLRRLDDRLDLTEAFLQGEPSIQAMNAAASKPPAPAGALPAPGREPAAQGAEGAMNAPQAPGVPGDLPGMAPVIAEPTPGRGPANFN